MIRRATFLWMSAIGTLAPRAAHGQRVADGTSAVTRADVDQGRWETGSAPPASASRRDSDPPHALRGREVAGGVVLGVAMGTAMAMGGAMTGAALASPCSGEFCQLEAAVPGFLLGESIGVATGAHFGAGGKGKLLVEVLVTTAITAAGVGVLAATHGTAGAAPVITLGLVPIAQLAAVLAIEGH